ncbi:putative serine/threonine-protein kinase vrk [Balamuthia mandrillaris]
MSDKISPSSAPLKLKLKLGGTVQSVHDVVDQPTSTIVAADKRKRASARSTTGGAAAKRRSARGTSSNNKRRGNGGAQTRKSSRTAAKQKTSTTAAPNKRRKLKRIQVEEEEEEDKEEDEEEGEEEEDEDEGEEEEEDEEEIEEEEEGTVAIDDEDNEVSVYQPQKSLTRRQKAMMNVEAKGHETLFALPMEAKSASKELTAEQRTAREEKAMRRKQRLHKQVEEEKESVVKKLLARTMPVKGEEESSAQMSPVAEKSNETVVPKRTIDGPKVTWTSNKNGFLLSFSEDAPVPSFFC